MGENFDNIVEREYKNYLEVYAEYDKDQDDKINQLSVMYAEQMLKVLYELRYGKNPIDDVVGWLAFWSVLGEKYGTS